MIIMRKCGRLPLVLCSRKKYRGPADVTGECFEQPEIADSFNIGEDEDHDDGPGDNMAC